MTLFSAPAPAGGIAAPPAPSAQLPPRGNCADGAAYYRKLPNRPPNFRLNANLGIIGIIDESLRFARPLSLPSVSAFPHLVRQRQRVFLLFLLRNQITMVLSAILYSIPIAGWRQKQVSYAFL